jgi:serine/threonine protein kinase/tetratricopeptide (TPR) repeat protein
MSDSGIFKAAVKLPADQRAAYLDQVCGDNPALRVEVESLLKAHEAPGSFLGRLGAGRGLTDDYQPSPERPGTVIGPYKLLQQIGEGGMGAVFMAEQTEPVRRMVAIKIIKPGMDSSQVIARFEAERQALALMDHPNIAMVLDAGTTAGEPGCVSAGRPYFVMELVKGVTITKFCDENQLTPRERLDLFIPVCQAVQHAHQKGIIHRDLKPNNVLVALYDDRPVPKVIDFGVAKATGEKLTERTLFTAFGSFVGTLEYMSPEQAKLNALDIDTRSDIYALGVLLYELLTGSTPLEKVRLKEAALDELLRIIREEDPPKPSTRLSRSGEALATISSRRGTEPAKLGKVLRGELDWIVMKALEKDRTRRYETANGLARDIQHYLADEPVEACPPSAGYRLRKLARKYRKPLAAAAAFAALLLAGVVVSTWQAVRATRAETAARTAEDEATKERDRARGEKENTQAVLDFLWQDVLSQISPWQVPGQDPKVRRLLDRAAGQLESESGKSPLVQASIRRMIGQIYAEMGDYALARRHLEQALEVQRRELGEDDPQTMTTMHNLGRSFLWSNDYDGAAPVLTRTLELRRRVLGEGNRDTLITTFFTGGCYAAQGRYEEGERLLRQAHEALSGPSGDRRQALGALLFLGLTLTAQGRLDEAEGLLIDCLKQSRKHLNDHNHTASVLRTLACIYLARNDPARAESLADEAVKRYRAGWGDPHPMSLSGLLVLARVYQLQGRQDKAAALLEEAQGVCLKFGLNYVPQEAARLGMLGENLVAAKSYVEAETPLRQCLQVWEKRLPRGGHYWLGLSRQGAARECAFAKCLLGASLLGQKKYEEAETQLRRGYEGLTLPQQAGDAGPTPFVKRRLVEALVWLVQLYEESDKPDEAAKWRKELEKAKAAAKKPTP